jgi:hypothetical protein
VAGILEGTTGAEALAMAPDGTAVAF